MGHRLHSTKWPRRRAGMSLIELVVSIAIILILAALVLTAAARIYKAVKALADGPPEQHQQQRQQQPQQIGS